jgi:hypothetical protein
MLMQCSAGSSSNELCCTTLQEQTQTALVLVLKLKHVQDEVL